MKPKIFFFPSYRYLSDPIFIPIANGFEAFYKIYYDFKDPFVKDKPKETNHKDNMMYYFDEYYELEDKFSNHQGLINRYKVSKAHKNQVTSELERLEPNIVLTCSDMTFTSRIIIKWCKKRDIPVIILQPAFIRGRKRRHAFHRLKYILFNKIFSLPIYRRQPMWGNEEYSTYLFLWSQKFSYNVEREKTFFLGNPAFDKLFKLFDNEKRQTDRIVICTQDVSNFAGKEKAQYILEIYKRAINEKKNKFFYIKIHPRESIDIYIDNFDSKEIQNVEIIKNNNLISLFKKSELQITVNSFTALQAAAMGLPVITINPKNALPDYEFFKGEINYKITEIDEISGAINKVLSDTYWKHFKKARKHFFQEWFHSTDGKSTERIRDKIREIYREKANENEIS